MGFIFLIALLIGSFSFSAPNCNLPFPIEIKYKTVNKVGKQYRKADVIIHIPFLVKSTVLKKTNNEKPEVKLEFKVEKDKALAYIKATKPLKRDLLLIQPIKEGFVYEEAHVKKIISLSPKVEEVFIVYPVDVKRNYISFPLPPLSLGEQLIVEYRFEGNLEKPYVKYVETSNKQKLKETKIFLTVKYSFLFKYAKSHVNDENVKNVKSFLKQLSNYGIEAKVEIVGFADGKSKNPKKNEEVAKRRALEIAKRIFPESVLSCLQTSIPVVKLSR